MNFQKLTTSSSDPTKLSTTVKGFLLMLLPVVMMFTGLTEAELGPIVDAVATVVFAGASLVSGLQILYGLGRKVYLGRWTW